MAPKLDGIAQRRNPEHQDGRTREQSQLEEPATKRVLATNAFDYRGLASREFTEVHAGHLVRMKTIVNFIRVRGPLPGGLRERVGAPRPNDFWS